MKFWPVSLLLLSLPLAAAEPTSSATADKPVPITIEADYLELDQKKGTSHYRGKVILIRGELQIEADSITLHTTDKQLRRAVAKGSPVHLQQQATTDAGAMRAQAEHMVYQPQNELIQLRGNAQLWRDGNEFKSEQISYNLKKQLVKASGDKQGDSRVRVLLQPEAAPPAKEKTP